MYLEDGKGSGRLARITPDHNVGVVALIEFPMEYNAHKGDAFALATDFINITTTATFSGLVYIKNTSADYVLHIESLRASSTVNAQWKMMKNPLAGTLISGGTPCPPSNLNFASGKTFGGTALKTSAGAGLTITDGTLLAQWLTSAYVPHTKEYRGGIIIAPGYAYAILCKPSAAGDVAVSVDGWLEKLE